MFDTERGLQRRQGLTRVPHDGAKLCTCTYKLLKIVEYWTCTESSPQTHLPVYQLIVKRGHEKLQEQQDLQLRHLATWAHVLAEPKHLRARLLSGVYGGVVVILFVVQIDKLLVFCAN